jgi:hypothetical protein
MLQLLDPLRARTELAKGMPCGPAPVLAAEWTCASCTPGRRYGQWGYDALRTSLRIGRSVEACVLSQLKTSYHEARVGVNGLAARTPRQLHGQAGDIGCRPYIALTGMRWKGPDSRKVVTAHVHDERNPAKGGRGKQEMSLHKVGYTCTAALGAQRCTCGKVAIRTLAVRCVLCRRQATHGRTHRPHTWRACLGSAPSRSSSVPLHRTRSCHPPASGRSPSPAARRGARQRCPVKARQCRPACLH